MYNLKPLNYYKYLKTLWKIADDHNHSVDTEWMALHITNQYMKIKNISYSKELAYVTTVIAAKVNEDGGGFNSLHYIPSSCQQTINLDEFEKDVVMTIGFDFYTNHFVNQIHHVLTRLHCHRPLSENFTMLLRFILWCHVDINTNLLTVMLAIDMLKKKNYLVIQNELKFSKTFDVLNQVALLTDVDINMVIKMYNQVKRDNI